MNLTDTQLMLLSAASRRQDLLLTLPHTLKGGAAKAVVTKLLGKGFVEEVPVGPAAPHWRRDEEDRLVGLKITSAGLEVIGVDQDDCACGAGSTALPASGSVATEPPTSRKPRGSDPREGSKKAEILSLLQREGGATLNDLVRATGWLPHTTRAALTGLRRRGYMIARTRRDGGESVYRIAEQAA